MAGTEIVLVGHLHGRPGYPEGLKICTSPIRSFNHESDMICFHTENSTYCCALHEYVTSSNSLQYLGSEELLQRAEQVEKNRLHHFLDLLSYNGTKNALVFNWCGCENPYLKWVVTFSDGQLQTIDEAFPEVRPLPRLFISLENGSDWRLDLTRSLSEYYFQDSGNSNAVLIENSGSKPLFLHLDSPFPSIKVSPGEIRRLKT